MATVGVKGLKTKIVTHDQCTLFWLLCSGAARSWTESKTEPASEFHPVSHSRLMTAAGAG